MGRPAGSKNKPKEITTDSYAEAFTGTGTGRDRSSFARIKPSYLLQQQELSDLYIGDGMARRIVDIPAEEMTRAGIDIETIEDEKLEEAIEARLEELDAMRQMNDAVRWSRLFGGSVMVFGLNDGGTLDVPLNPDGIRGVEFMRVYDRWQATIQTKVTDPMLPTYGKPELWQISPQDGGQPYVVHASRVYQFDGDAIPDILRQANQGWGASALQSCRDQLIRLGMSHQYANMLLERSQQAVHGIPGLSNILRAPGGEAAMQRRVDVVDMVRGILNTVVTDADETYTITSQSLSGVPDVLDRFAEALAAVTGIPVTVLMGRAPGGLSATGKADLDNWYARIEAMQNDILRKPLDMLVNYIIVAKTGQDGGNYSLKFKPLTVKSDKENAEIDKLKAEANKIQADADSIYVGIGSIDPREIRAGLDDKYEIDAMPEITEPDEEEA